MRAQSLILTLLLLLPFAIPLRPRDAPSEVRALWGVRTTVTFPEGIRRMVATARGAGFNTLIVQVRGRGDAYYHSRWEPRARELADQDAKFDPLALTLAEAHQAGLKVHAWVNTSAMSHFNGLRLLSAAQVENWAFGGKRRCMFLLELTKGICLIPRLGVCRKKPFRDWGNVCTSSGSAMPTASRDQDERFEPVRV